MKRAVLSTLVGIGLLSFGFWTGRSSASLLPSDAQIVSDMNQAVKQAAQTNEVIFLREMLRREMALRIAADPLHRYGGQPCRAAD